MTGTSKGHRSAAAAALLLLLAVVFGPLPGGAQPYTAVSSPVRATEPARHAASVRHAVPAPAGAGQLVRADAPDTGSSCRQQDVPLKDAETAVASGHADPVTAPGTARAPLPQATAPRATAPRAPPAPAAGCAELLPVLRI
ncbi:hypothetical protein FGW37_11765 [Streptomyces rectiverticillatus]|uniref:hypothetical protein n=1 Tax=Streptomyces rectiverticillatus TaxID=173860 RepID=UPI0015C38997|nr:hypothetical protein [Streptomyces rectiverticillatus]QLE72182.1 hypothetical protein FGW37_11765 [Streptomyces rectiverticillatus]